MGANLCRKQSDRRYTDTVEVDPATVLALRLKHHRMLAPGHFAAPYCGRVSRKGEAFRCHPGQTQ
jgi:hypothetical protein